jgi:hypothetical protein
MDKKIPFERVKKIALENISAIHQRLCSAHKATVVVVKHYLETGEALRTRANADGERAGCPSVSGRLTETIKEFIQGLDVRCVGELLELIPKGLDNRLPGWLYGPVVAQLGEDGWELVPAA